MNFADFLARRLNIFILMLKVGTQLVLDAEGKSDQIITPKSSSALSTGRKIALGWSERADFLGYC